MVGLYSFITFFSTSHVIKGMIAAVVPIVAVMLGVMAYEFGEKAIKGLGWPAGVTFFIISFLLLQTIIRTSGNRDIYVSIIRSFSSQAKGQVDEEQEAAWQR